MIEQTELIAIVKKEIAIHHRRKVEPRLADLDERLSGVESSMSNMMLTTSNTYREVGEMRREMNAGIDKLAVLVQSHGTFISNRRKVERMLITGATSGAVQIVRRFLPLTMMVIAIIAIGYVVYSAA